MRKDKNKTKTAHLADASQKPLYNHTLLPWVAFLFCEMRYHQTPILQKLNSGAKCFLFSFFPPFE